MEITLHFENVGIGDCLLLYLKEPESDYKLLVDCGSYNLEVIRLFNDYKINHLDKLILTHFDNDHIVGLIKLLEHKPDLKIDDIWFNCYQHLPSGESIPLTKFQREAIARLYHQLPSIASSTEHNISAENALLLSKIIIENPDWKKVWNSLNISVENINEYNLGKWGTIRILSPTTNELAELEKIFKIEFCKKLYGKAASSSFEMNNEIYELLLRTIEDNSEELTEEEYSISSKILLNKQLIEEYSNVICEIDNTATNRSSIAFIWTVNNHSILFLGDSAPDIILTQIKKYKEEKGIANKLLIFDAIKVSHHGSKRNITKKLLSEIDSEHFIFCGRSEKRPDEITISKIINRDLPDSFPIRKLIFNHENKIVKNFNSNKIIQDEFKFIIEIDTKIGFNWK